MCEHAALRELTEMLAGAAPDVDSETTGQYGDGLGSEDEERQLEFSSAAFGNGTRATEGLIVRSRIPSVLESATWC